MISVLLPSRGRAALLGRSVGSLRDRAAGEIEVLVGSDLDDPDTATAARGLGCDVLVLPRQGYELLHVYYQRLAAEATGDWLLVWNDDAVMLTEGWDLIIEGLPERVLVADLLSNHSPLCCFPAVRREAMRKLGRFCSDNPHVDTFWQDAGRATGTIEVVPVQVWHEQRWTPHLGNEHGFYGPAHQAELDECVGLLRG